VRTFTNPIATPPPTIIRASTGILIKNQTTPAEEPKAQLSHKFAKSSIRRKKVRSIDGIL